MVNGRHPARWNRKIGQTQGGACGTRRFRLPLTIAVLTVVEGRIVPEILSVE
jgi:hypothetical protein